MKGISEILIDAAGHFPASKLIAADGTSSVTFSHLLTKAQSIGYRLTQLGLTTAQPVGIFLPKSADSVAAIFGILQSGAIYVPADVHAPIDRAEYIFADSQVAFIVTDKTHGDKLYPDFVRVQLPDSPLVIIVCPKQSETSLTLPPDLAYILYTSGSTGRPKGVMITHANAICFIDWAGQNFSINEEDTLTSIAPFHFDLSIFDLFVAIKRGANLVLVSAKTAKNPRLFAAVIAERAVSLLYATPSLLQLLLRFGNIKEYDFSSLRTVLYAGEVFPVAPLGQLQQHWPNTTFYNLYGPTETNVVTWQEVPDLARETEISEIPIGYSCPFAACAILVDGQLTVEPGQIGELAVTGTSVAVGYLGSEAGQMPVLVDDQTRRWYRTGDLVEIDQQRAFVFRGRIDRMVKRRGYRIEPAEIERALLLHPAIERAVVVHYTDAKQEVKIQAFLVSATDTEPVNFLALKLFCQQNLPLYMLPDGFLFLDKIPQTSSQKIDYQQLKALLNA